MFSILPLLMYLPEINHVRARLLCRPNVVSKSEYVNRQNNYIQMHTMANFIRLKCIYS